MCPIISVLPPKPVYIIGKTLEEVRSYAYNAGFRGGHFVPNPTAVRIAEDCHMRTAIMLDSWIERDDFLEINAALIARGIKRISPCKKKLASTRLTRKNM